MEDIGLHFCMVNCRCQKFKIEPRTMGGISNFYKYIISSNSIALKLVKLIKSHVIQIMQALKWSGGK